MARCSTDGPTPRGCGTRRTPPRSSRAGRGIPRGRRESDVQATSSTNDRPVGDVRTGFIHPGRTVGSGAFQGSWGGSGPHLSGARRQRSASPTHQSERGDSIFVAKSRHGSEIPLPKPLDANAILRDMSSGAEPGTADDATRRHAPSADPREAWGDATPSGADHATGGPGERVPGSNPHVPGLLGGVHLLERRTGLLCQQRTLERSTTMPVLPGRCEAGALERRAARVPRRDLRQLRGPGHGPVCAT
jgi:hypothetical protein